MGVSNEDQSWSIEFELELDFDVAAEEEMG